MQNLEPYQIWLLMAAVAYVAYLFGRASMRREPDYSESRETRRLRSEADAESLFSSIAASKQGEADRLLGDGKFIDAVKLIREETGAGLKQSKEAADRRKRQLRG